ncbi:SDR family NAD(P)-dependent oxidoreductase, partial [Pseudomonas sp. SID14000]|uniref:SDR family NAD(P)-dependent oxidoreductase n=1 Tax=Pseudomonas sp. SID14000 TaxID=1986221 RepID=UPI0034D26B75
MNNAGIGLSGSFLETPAEDWKKVLDVNLWGVIHGCRLFGKQMAERGQGGHIVNTASADGGIAPLPTASVYAVTKAAVVTMTESLYAHLKAEGAGVGASVLFPGRTCCAPGCGSRTATGPNGTPRSGPAGRRNAASASGSRRCGRPGRRSSSHRSSRSPTRSWTG